MNHVQRETHVCLQAAPLNSSSGLHKRAVYTVYTPIWYSAKAVQIRPRAKLVSTSSHIKKKTISISMLRKEYYRSQEWFIAILFFIERDKRIITTSNFHMFSQLLSKITPHFIAISTVHDPSSREKEVAGGIVLTTYNNYNNTFPPPHLTF